METRETPKTPASLLYAMANKRPQLQQGRKSYPMLSSDLHTCTVAHSFLCSNTRTYTQRKELPTLGKSTEIRLFLRTRNTKIILSYFPNPTTLCNCWQSVKGFIPRISKLDTMTQHCYL